MNDAQAIMAHPITKVAQRARKLGYAVGVRNGKCQLQTVTYEPSGASVVQRLTDWMTADQATALLDEAAA